MQQRLQQQNDCNLDKSHVVRDPIHGLIEIYPWEKRIIDTPEFQRLKRIHQLGTTHYIYPGAEHSRFSHSLGVMHVATRIFDQLAKRPPLNEMISKDKEESDQQVQKLRNTVRLGALLHDIGHGCFSHAGDDSGIFPELTIGEKKESGHEAYSKLIIKQSRFEEILKEFYNDTGGVEQNDIISALNGDIYEPDRRFIYDIISGQLDADKMDYLLRDSYFCGVKYGNYDLERLIISLRLIEIPNAGWILGVDKNGIQAVEEFVLARYWMFVQVYFHKYRRLYDKYLVGFLVNYLHDKKYNGCYPENIDDYIKLDDYVLFNAVLRSAFSGSNPDDEKHEKQMKYFAEKLVFRGHHKIAFDPPHHHTLSKRTREQKIEYKRYEYIKDKFTQYLKDMTESEQDAYADDYAKGKNIRNYFDVTVYSNEEDPIYDENGDLQERKKDETKVPTIPVLTGEKHHPFRAIQHYSPLIDSVSDKTYSIYRIYCIEDKLESIVPKLDVLGKEAEDYIRNIKEKLHNDEAYHREEAKRIHNEREKRIRNLALMRMKTLKMTNSDLAY